MNVIPEILDIRQAFIKAIVLETLIQTGQAKPFISKREAHRRFGRKLVDRWIAEKLIEPQKDGDTNFSIRLELQRLILLAGESNRCSFYENHRESEL